MLPNRKDKNKGVKTETQKFKTSISSRNASKSKPSYEKQKPNNKKSEIEFILNRDDGDDDSNDACMNLTFYFFLVREKLEGKFHVGYR